MDIKKHKELLNQILTNLGNQALVSNLLTELAEDNKKVESELGTTTEKLTSLESDNESLRKANNKLFIKLGEQDDEVEKELKNKDSKKDETDEVEEEVMPTIESLFNEKGELI